MLVNPAGVALSGRFEKLRPEEFRWLQVKPASRAARRGDPYNADPQRPTGTGGAA